MADSFVVGSIRLCNKLTILLYFCLLLVNKSDTKVAEGHLVTSEKWHFLARFCFLSDSGRLRFEFKYDQVYQPLEIQLYYDDADQWPAVYKSNKSCLERRAVLRPENNQIIVLTPEQTWSGCAVERDNATQANFYKCAGGRSFRSMRERWWFIVASNCQAKDGLNISYKMIMTNDEDHVFFKHFSADEFYILQMDICFLFIFAFMVGLSIFVSVRLSARQLLHSTYKLFMASLCSYTLYIFFMCICLGLYANDGYERVGFKTFARIFESVSILIFILMLILMAKGYTITRGKISTPGSIKIAVFMTLYVITYAILFIYQASLFDPGEVLYLYESPAGYGLIALRLLAWIWFCYATFFTLKHYPEKGTFYYPFFVLYTLWFWAVVVIILLANLAMPRWLREKVVTGVLLGVEFIAYAMFLFLTRPSAANKNFPYHVRTSQIGIQNITNQHLPENQNGSSGYTDPNTGLRLTSNGAPDFSELFVVTKNRTPPPPEKLDVQEDSSLDDRPIADAYESYPHQKPGSNPFVVS